MHWKPRGWTLIGMLLLAIPGAMTVMKVTAAAQAASGKCNCYYAGYRYDLSRGWNAGGGTRDCELAGVYYCEWAGGAERDARRRRLRTGL